MAKDMIINIQVTELPRSIAFYEAIGFVKHPFFSDDTAVGMVLRSNTSIAVMLITREKFRSFTSTTKEVVDACKASEVLLALTAETREEVDEIAETAVKAGGGAHPIVESGFDEVYYRQYEDPDGHIWEAVWVGNECKKKAKEVLAAVLGEKK
ncbi:hypothetical protein VTO42DRAFT_3469 [Malbranchea cinnamomea]